MQIHKFPKKLGATSKLWVPQERKEARPIPRTHKHWVPTYNSQLCDLAPRICEPLC